MLMCLIDVMELHHVATVDIHGVFMQAYMKGETVHMKLEKKVVEIITKFDPKLYRNYFRTEKGKSVLYVELNTVLYGTLHTIMMF